MNPIRTFSGVLAAAAVALAADLLPTPLCAQIPDQVQARSPLIVIDGVVLQSGTAIEQHSLLGMIVQSAIESIEVLKGAAAVERFGDAARDGVIVIRLKSELARTQPGAAQSPAPLFVVDGIIVPGTVLGALEPQDIEKIAVIKGAAAELFGEAGRAGVIQITTRKRQLH